MNHLTRYGKLYVLASVMLLLALFFPQINKAYGDVKTLLEQSGNFAPLAYMLLMIAAILISPLPSSPLAIFGGIFFGPFAGMTYTLIGATIGAVIAFLIARFFLRDYLSRKLEKNAFYRKIRGAKEKNIAVLVFLTRLMPHVSFDVVSYAAGLTNLRVFTFTLVTFAGMIPIVFLLSFFSALIQPYLQAILIAVTASFVLYITYLTLKKETNTKTT